MRSLSSHITAVTPTYSVTQIEEIVLCADLKEIAELSHIIKAEDSLYSKFDIVNIYHLLSSKIIKLRRVTLLA